MTLWERGNILTVGKYPRVNTLRRLVFPQAPSPMITNFLYAPQVSAPYPYRDRRTSRLRPQRNSGYQHPRVQVPWNHLSINHQGRRVCMRTPSRKRRFLVWKHGQLDVFDKERYVDAQHVPSHHIVHLLLCHWYWQLQRTNRRPNTRDGR